jgi:hypothetical protein
MAKSLRPLGIALALLILLSASLNVYIPSHPALAAVEKPDTPCRIMMADPQDEGTQQLGPEGIDLEQELPIMKPSQETRQKWIEGYKKAPKANINEKIKLQLEQAPGGGSFSLLNHLQYTPSQRNQGSCGNCWAWAGTGVIEVALDVQKAIKDRLSIQYLNSNYNGGSGPNWACCGGWIDDVADFYTSTGRAIPWSNTNSSYQDGSRTCSSGSTNMPAGSIDTSYYYPITSITTETITTQGVTQTTAIANIKNVLDQNKAVWFGYFLPTSADWSNFRTFWSTQPETTIWNPNFSCGHTWDAGGGGHAVLCVGYDDTDSNPANHYWLMLNSWGTAGGNRPNGLFRLAMDMNYSCQDNVGGYTFYWQTLNTTFQNPVQTQKLIGADDSTATGNTANSYFILDRFLASQTGNVTEIRVKCGASGNVKVAIYDDSFSQPNSRLAAVDSSTPVTTGWNTISIPSTSVTSGTYYWLAFNMDVSCVSYKQQGTTTRWFKPATYSSFSFPNPAGSGFTTGYTDWYDYIAGWGTITPPSAPTITNSTGASNITSTSARLNGEVTSTGNENPAVTIYYGTTDGGNTQGNWASHLDLGTKGQETFYADVSNLTPNTPYYYRSYASNSAGFGWANTSAQFTTPTQTQILVGVDTGTTATGGSGVCSNVVMQRFLATSTGSITQFRVKVSTGGNVKVAIYDDSSGQPNSRLATVSSTLVSAGWNTIPITSTPVTSSTYYWLAVLSDSCNIYYHSNDPSANVRWQPATYSSWTFPNPAGSGWNIQTGYTYFIAGWGTITPPSAPTITNSTGASNITSTSARLNGEVTSTGNENPAVTIYYGTTDGGNTQGNWASHVDLGTKGQETFYADVSNLTPNTPYYYRSYASNSAGFGWADDNSAQFTTLVQTQKIIGADDYTATGNTANSYFILDRFLASQTGNVTEIKVKCGASGNVKVAIYDDSFSQPNSRLAAVDSSTPVTAGWNTISIPSTSVTSGTYYWLAFNMDVSCVSYKQQGPTTRWFKPATYSSFSFPNPAGSGFTTGYTDWYDYIAGWGTIIPPTPPNPPDIISPGAAIIFKWGAPNGATKYQLQVSTSSSFTTTVFDADVGNNTSQEVTGLSLGVLYYWRVRAGNIGGWGNWSTTRSVTVNQVP